MTLRMIAAVLSLLPLLALPAQADSKRVWAFVTFDDRAQLFYGVPESDAITIALVCAPKTKSVEIFSAVLPRRPKDKQALTMTLRNGKASVSFKGTTTYDPEDGFQFTASTGAERTLVDVLRSGSALTIDMPGRQHRVPLRGVTKPLKQFEAACFGG